MQNEMFQPEPAAPAPVPRSASLSARQRVLAWTRRAWRPAGTVVAVLLALLLMGHVINGKNGISVWRQKRVEDRELQKQIRDVQQENAQLRQQIERLKSDPDAIEHEAREKLHYAKPGEVIYTLPTSAPDQTPPTAPSK
jgi:cell division protein FtsB